MILASTQEMSSLRSNANLARKGKGTLITWSEDSSITTWGDSLRGQFESQP